MSLSSQFSISCNSVLYFLVQVVLLKTTVKIVETHLTFSRAACVSSVWTARQWTWLWCSNDCWETTASCKSICVASLTGQNHQNQLLFSVFWAWCSVPTGNMAAGKTIFILNVPDRGSSCYHCTAGLPVSALCCWPNSSSQSPVAPADWQ